MNFKGTLIVVEDCKKAFEFYNELFGFELISDNDGNMELSGGLYLQEKKYWEAFTGQSATAFNNASELYFEESDIAHFIERLEKIYPTVKYLNRLTTHSWGQKAVRFYDPNGNLIEVGTPMQQKTVQLI